MEIFKGNNHIGIVVLYDFGDGEYRLGVLQSTSARRFKTYSVARFMYDDNAGPNITPLTEDNYKKWNYIREPNINNEEAFFFDPDDKFYLWRDRL